MINIKAFSSIRKVGGRNSKNTWSRISVQPAFERAYLSELLVLEAQGVATQFYLFTLCSGLDTACAHKRQPKQTNTGSNVSRARGTSI